MSVCVALMKIRWERPHLREGLKSPRRYTGLLPHGPTTLAITRVASPQFAWLFLRLVSTQGQELPVPTFDQKFDHGPRAPRWFELSCWRARRWPRSWAVGAARPATMAAAGARGGCFGSPPNGPRGSAACAGRDHRAC